MLSISATLPHLLAAPARHLRRALFGLRRKEMLSALLHGLRPARPERSHARLHPFDLHYGVDTSGFLSPDALATGHWSDAYSECYWGTQPSVARHGLDLVPAPERFTFLDIGCGKGRVAIIASEYGFRRIIGIELSEPLAETAARNAAILAQRFPERPRIEIRLEDAARLQPPPEPLLLFLYNPFLKPVFRRFMQRVAASRRERPRPILMLYVNPRLGRLLDRSPDFRRLHFARVAIEESERPFKTDGEESFGMWECVAGD